MLSTCFSRSHTSALNTSSLAQVFIEDFDKRSLKTVGPVFRKELCISMREAKGHTEFVVLGSGPKGFLPLNYISVLVYFETGSH